MSLKKEEQMSKLFYTEGFIRDIKDEYPKGKYPNLNKALDNGSYTLGNHLDDNSNFLMEPHEIVTAFKNNNEKIVREAAEKTVRRKFLLKRWKEIYHFKKD
jgi:hypothetical protein